MIRIAGHNKALRIFLAAVAIALLLWTGVSLYRAISATPDQIKTVSYYPESATSLDMARKDVDGFFQTGVLLLAGLWGVAVVKKDDRLRRRDIPEIVMFTTATILLVAFLFVAQQYGQLLERLYWDFQPLINQKKMFIDLFDSPYIRLYYDSLYHCFYAALAVSAVATFSLCLLRGENHG